MSQKLRITGQGRQRYENADIQQCLLRQTLGLRAFEGHTHTYKYKLIIACQPGRTGRSSASDAMPSVAGSEKTMPRNKKAPRK